MDRQGKSTQSAKALIGFQLTFNQFTLCAMRGQPSNFSNSVCIGQICCTHFTTSANVQTAKQNVHYAIELYSFNISASAWTEQAS